MRGSFSTDELSRLIGLIYDCVFDAARWSSAIDAVREALGFMTAEISVRRLPDGAPLMAATAGIAPEWLQRFQQEGAEGGVELWGGAERIARFPLAEPIVLSHAVSRAHIEAHPMHRNFAVPMGIADLVSIALLHDRDALAAIGLGWPAARGTIQEQHLAPLRLLAPHLRRAVTIARLIEVHRQAAGTFAETLDALTSAVLLLDGALAVVHANAAAQALLRTREVMTIGAGHTLCLAARQAQLVLADAVARSANHPAALGQRGMAIPLTRAGGGAPLVAHVLPLRAGLGTSGVSPRAVVAVFIGDAAAAQPVPLKALTLLYDLTPAEARVFELVVAGRATKEIARFLGLAPSTVKTHMLRVFDKTGCHRQSDLVRLSASLAA